jgi:SAM-dependent methyltransferase
MNYEKQYYEFERFWNNYEYSYKINIDKINITFDFIKKDVKNLLDAACGNGIFTNMVSEKFENLKVVAFDRSETALKYVKTEKYLASIDAIPFNDQEFDCVVAHDVIEHLPVDVYDKALKEIARVARKYIIIGVPFDENLRHNVSECPYCLSHFNNDFHFRSFDKKKMSGLLAASGFRCVEIRTCDTNKFFVGHRTYGNLFYPKWQKKFRSPICPVCGFVNPEDKDPDFKIGIEETVAPAGILPKIKRIPKLLWPKYSKDYEMVALFQKENTI